MKQKKSKKQRKIGLFYLFICSFLVTFLGFVIIYVGAVTINCLFNGFDGFISKLCDLPYLLYLLLSLILSIVFILRINRATKA